MATSACYITYTSVTTERQALCYADPTCVTKKKKQCTVYVPVVCQVLFQDAGPPELAHVCNTTYQFEVNNQSTDMLML